VLAYIVANLERKTLLWLLVMAPLIHSCLDIPKEAAPETVSLTYTPVEIAKPVKGAGTVAVIVNDLRADPQKVGNVTGTVLKAGKGVITTSGDVKEIVQKAVQTELVKLGFAAGTTSATVLIDVTQFDLQHVVVSSDDYQSQAKILMHAEVRGADQKIFYSQLITGQSYSSNGSDEQTLSLALNRAVANLITDPEFVKAILTAEAGQSR
jgi:uncharacterized lipoprotein YajG